MSNGTPAPNGDPSPQGDTAIRNELNETLAAAVKLHRDRHLRQAETLYRAILAIDPHHADALHLLGVLVDQVGQHEAARDLIARAIAGNPRVAAYHFNLGVALQALRDFPAAAVAYRSAVELEPRYRQALENLGVALQDGGDLGGARAAYERALAIAPESVIAHLNLGTLLHNTGLTQEARAHFDAVLDGAPADAEAHWKRALTLLAEGRFAEGWAEYEWRRHAPSFVERNPPRVVPFSTWDGSSLEGKTILIDREQGVGDEIMFASCYQDVIDRAAHCVIESDARLVDLFARSFPTATVVPARHDRAGFAWDESLPRCDYRVSAGSLPRFCRSHASDFMRRNNYLHVDRSAETEWRERLLALGPGLKVGISWRGGTDPRAQAARSIPLAEWVALLGDAGAHFIDLQYGDHAEEIEDVRRAGSASLHSLPGVDPLRDLDGFSALIAALDLVVSIDNSTVFVAGAVGVPVWVLLPSSAEWRWSQSGETSLWFPSARLFRQQRPGIESWRVVLREVAAALRRHERRSDADAPHERPAAAAIRPIAASTRPAIEDNRALLINDTSNWYHWGCSCTNIAIHEQLRARCRAVQSLPIQRIRGLAPLPNTVDEFDDDEIYRGFAAAHEALVAAIEAADIVVINGEGTLHNVGRDAVGLLYLAHVAARRFGRRVHMINHSAFPDDTAAASDSPACALYRKVYANLAFVAAREELSRKVLADLGVAATQSFDCLPLFVERHWSERRRRERHGVVIAGSAAWGSGDPSVVADFATQANRAGVRPTVLIGASADLAGDDRTFTATLQRLAPGQFDVVNAASEMEWLDTIAAASMLISGRFHHSIAAAFLSTPFVVMESNSPKIQGLLQMLGAGAFASIATPGLASIFLEQALYYARSGNESALSQERRRHLLALSLANFAGL